jgi:RNase adaptor protein for sRNA GlmZ degradation
MMPDSSGNGPVIHIVGVCGSGKSTLARRLNQRGYQARQISQEHSVAPELWRWRCTPDALVYLDASNEQIRQRYPTLNMTDPYLEKERKRLAHAREHADCIILTDGLTPDQVAARALTCLEEMGIRL